MAKRAMAGVVAGFRRRVTAAVKEERMIAARPMTTACRAKVRRDPLAGEAKIHSSCHLKSPAA
jgi:hypothetical protein